jgi:hypothetical protein
MAEVWKWGLEGPPTDDSYTAQQHWLDAIDATMEALEMAFPATLLGHIDEVEELLQNLIALPRGCCPPNLTYFDPLRPTDPGYSYDGETFPDPWGESETPSDVDDWRELVCGAANAYMDYLEGIGDELDELVLETTLVIGAIAAILGLLSGAGLLMALSYGSVASITSGIVANATSNLFGSAATALAAARADIICAMITFNGDTLADAIEAEVSSLAWSLFFQWIDYQAALDILATGEFGGSYLPIVRVDGCICDAPLAAGMNKRNIVYTDLSDPRTSNGAETNHEDQGAGVIRLYGITMNITTYGHYILGYDDTHTNYPMANPPPGYTLVRAATKITMVARDNDEEVRFTTMANFPSLAAGASIIYYLNNGLWSGYDWDAEADTAVNSADAVNAPNDGAQLYLGSQGSNQVRNMTVKIECYFWLIAD